MDMLNGDVDIAYYRRVYLPSREAFEKKGISVIGSIDKYKAIYLYGRKDRGIENISDLKGKRIGITRGAIDEFYLGRFLDLHGMSIKDITLVDFHSLHNMSDAITNGSVDCDIS